MERQDTTIIETRNTRASINLKVEYQRLNAFFADYTTNISKGGTFISTNEPLDVGTEFAFKLDVPGVEEVLSLKGIVRWVVSVDCLLYTSPSPRDRTRSRMPSSA